MTDTQPEALKLADELLFAGRFANESEEAAFRRRFIRNESASRELRRLHEVNQELLNALKLLRTEAGEGDLAAWFIKEVTDDLIAKAEVLK